MFRPILFLLSAFVFLFFGTEVAFSAPRETVLLNRAWKYRQGDIPGAERIGFDVSAWEDVGIPHSFSLPYFLSKEFYVGYGWYRKDFTLDKGRGEKVVSLEFDGVFQEAEIFVKAVRLEAISAAIRAFPWT